MTHCQAKALLNDDLVTFSYDRVVVIEASQLLGSFDRRLRQYAANKLIKSGVTLRRGMVKEAFKDHVSLQVRSRMLGEYWTNWHQTPLASTQF